MKTGIAVPPAPTSYTAYWERGLDPFHREAFTGIPEVFFGIKWKKSKRKEGWHAIDHAGNSVAFVPDGTEIEPYHFNWVLKEGYPGRACAVRHNCLGIFYAHFNKEKK